MSSLRRGVGPLLIALATAGAVAACGGGGAAGGGGENQLSGSVRIDGSSTVAPISTVAAEQFMTQNPGVQVTVGTPGTGGGFEKFCAGETDISDASRPIEDDEKQVCGKNGIQFDEFSVATDALTVVVSKQNTWAKCLTVDQLKQIWEPNSKVKTWKQVDPSFPNEPLKLFGPGTDSGTFDYFTEEINGEEGASRTDYSPSEDDNVIVQGVAGSKGGLGYFGYSYFEENQDKLNAVQIDGGDGCVEPSVQTAQDGSYTPLARPVFIYPSAKSMQRPEVEAFVTYYAQNAVKMAEAAKLVPLNEQQNQELQAKLESLKSQG
ncbi:MAG: phosphate ABC transporter substrate-binding protein PstS family protein [Streptosporangiales bacterium]|nr:phosphate ABC transporter substrate-binding protein PstS family protein [Streptosporangiales bacterium]